MDDANKVNLARKLLALQNTCSYIQKKGKNAFHGYKYATAADVFEKVNAAMCEIGLISRPKFASESITEIPRQGKSPERIVEVSCVLTVIDAATGYGEVCSEALGAGQDSGDKAVMKAQTAALKYAWTTLLNISTGDDPEEDSSVDKRNEEPVLTRPPANNTPTAALIAAPAGPKEKSAPVKDCGLKPPTPDGHPCMRPVGHPGNHECENERNGMPCCTWVEKPRTTVYDSGLAVAGAILGPTPAAPRPSVTVTKNFKFMEQMRKQKSRVGKDAYYKVLGGNGFTHCNEVTDRKIQVGLFKELETLPEDKLGDALDA